MSTGIIHGGVNVAGVEVRVLTEESHAIASQATQYGVETGKSISDHVIMTPNTVDISFEMTNTNGGAERARAAFQEFVKLCDGRMPLILDTEHARYKNMVLTGFNPNHRAPFKGAYAASVRLTQVGVVGESNMVSATGGRAEGFLASDGTQKTGTGYQYAGSSQPTSNRALSDRITNTLSGYSNLWKAA